MPCSVHFNPILSTWDLLSLPRRLTGDNFVKYKQGIYGTKTKFLMSHTISHQDKITAKMEDKHNIIARLEGVSKEYHLGDQRIVALEKTDLQVRMGELLLIIGPSGSGKTTLLSL